MKRLILTTAAALLAAPAMGGPCEDLTGVTMPNTTIDAAEATAPFSATDPMFGPLTVKTGFCRVLGTIAPAIKFQVWLPEAKGWNGKLQGVGNGGVAGSIAQGSLANGCRAWVRRRLLQPRP